MKRLITIIILAIGLQVSAQTNWTNAVGAWQTKDSVGTKKFGFRANTGIRYDFDDRYSLRTGSNASGTWEISITGNAATATNWGGISADFDTFGTGSVGYLTGYDSGGTDMIKPFQAPAIRTFLGIPSGGETLQSVTDRGNTTTTGATFGDNMLFQRASLSDSPNSVIISNTSTGSSGIQLRNSYLPSNNNWQFFITNEATPKFKIGQDFIGDYLTILTNGNVGINTTNPTAKLEVNGNVIASDATASNHLVTKSQLDLKANTDGSNATGTWGINISGNAATVNNGVYTTDNQTIAGVKTFSSSPIVPAPTTDYQVATKKYVDDAINGLTLASGTYPPNITSDDDLYLLSGYSCHYMRIGNEVTVTGAFTILDDGAVGSTNIYIDIPISVNNFTDSFQAIGSATINNSEAAGQTKSALISASLGQKKVQLFLLTGSSTEQVYAFNFKYTIIN